MKVPLEVSPVLSSPNQYQLLSLVLALCKMAPPIACQPVECENGTFAED